MYTLHPINIAANHLPNKYWWAMENIETKGCIVLKWVIPRLNIHVFISLLDFLSMQKLFFYLGYHSVLQLPKKCWLCSSRTYSKQNFCITGNVLYLSNNSHNTVTFFLTEFSSSFSFELQSYEKENMGKVIITLAFICT